MAATLNSTKFPSFYSLGVALKILPPLSDKKSNHKIVQSNIWLHPLAHDNIVHFQYLLHGQ